MGEAATPEDRSDHDRPKKGASSPRAQSSEQGAGTSPKPKRRKVNHACLYCRRSHMTCDLERPCTRCIKRNIGHLCHDEPREPGKRGKNDNSVAAGENDNAQVPAGMPTGRTMPTLDQQQQQQQQVDQQLLQENGINMAQGQPAPQGGMEPVNPGTNAMLNPNNWGFGARNQFHDMHNLHPYLFHAPEVTNEYTLLNDFLSSSMLDDNGMYSGNNQQGPYTDGGPASNLASTAAAAAGVGSSAGQQPPPQLLNPPNNSSGNMRAPQTDKAQEEAYYLTAADPSGNDAPDARINALLEAKYKAGMLRPFNYVKGYARLNRYMEQHMQPESRQKILRQVDKFRPKFRERMQSLTDVELVWVEMWFERCLMEYDRVFASMAVPACCWRRTGEIFRGNKEMAELIHVPIESLRDGKLAIHDIIVEEHLVSYWQKFGAIAFDSSQKAMLTSCSLKNPDLRAQDQEIPCCFSFTIVRDEHNIPSLIVGNFLPRDLPKHL